MMERYRAVFARLVPQRPQRGAASNDGAAVVLAVPASIWYPDRNWMTC